MQEAFGVVAVQAYRFNDAEDGQTYWWNATEGRRVAEGSGRPTVTVDLAQAGMTKEAILRMYPDLDTGKAEALPLGALFDPLLFVRHRGKDVLIDGWHRLYKAAYLEIEVLPAYVLTQEESDAVRMEGT